MHHGASIMWLAYWFMAIVSIVKEMWLDDKGDMEDVLYGAAGGMVSILIYYVV